MDLASDNARTQQQLAQRRLQESEQRLRLLGDNLPESVVYQYLHEADGTPRFLYISAGIERLNGVRVEEVLQDAGALHRQIAPGYIEALREAEARSARELSDFAMDVPMRRPDGQVRWMRLRSRPHRLPDGRVVWDGVQTDITEHREVEEALRRSEEKFAKVFASNPAAMGVTRLRDGQILDVNQTWEKLFGYRRDEAIGQTSLLLHLWPALEDRARWIDELLTKGCFQAREQMVVNKAGEPVATLASAEIIMVDGEKAILSTWLDITHRKQAEDSLKQDRTFIRQLIDADPNLVFVKDEEGRFVLANQAMADLYRMPAEALVSRLNAEMLAGGEDYEQYRRIDAQALATGKSITVEETHRCQDGRVLWFLTTKVPVCLPDGRRAVLGVAVDITARRHQEEELRTAKAGAELAKAIAESANRTKDQFIATLSHELRTPLTPALAAVSVLQGDGRLPADVLEDLEMIRRNIDLEVQLIGDLLDVSRVVSGKLHLEKRPIDVAEVIRESARIVRGDMQGKQQVLTIETPGAPYLASADPTRLQQVFWNLLRNAIKFTPEHGAIAVRAVLHPAEHCPLAAELRPVGTDPCPLPPADADAECCQGDLVISVSDTGKGISPEMLPRVFTAFEQAHDARSLGGLGLGLAICKAVVEMHGGSIAAHSDGPGQGATFTLHLPVTRCPKRPASPVPTPPPPVQARTSAPGVCSRPRRILLVEDNGDTAMMMQRLLRSRGYEVQIAGSIAAALQAVEAQMPDLLIGDIGLPDGSGLDLMRQLRSRHPHLQAIALSGYGAESDIQSSQEVGFLVHLTKPIDLPRLAQVIESMAKR